MATSSRLRGNVAPIFTLKLGTGTATSYADDLKKYKLVHAAKSDSDLTFAEAAAGLGSVANLEGTCLTSFDTTSLYGFMFNNPGATVTVTFGPYGNATPSATKPHFTWSARLPGRPDLENEAGTGPDGASADFVISGDNPVTILTA